MACAWATFLCYGSMMVISYRWGQQAYRIPYATKNLVAYLVIVALIYFIHLWITGLWTNGLFSFALATLLTLGFALFIVRIEKREFRKLPFIGKYV